MAMKFPELFYWKHTRTLPAYWVVSPSKYPPWAAMKLAQRRCHCWTHFWNSCCGVTFSVVVLFLWMPSVSRNLRPFKAHLIYGKSQKPFEVKSGEYDGCSVSVIDFWAEYFFTESAFWVEALSWWRIQLLDQSSGLFLRTVSRNRFSIST
jgi:hypothetical protein